MISRLVFLEISGPLAMFARPDTGGPPTSYPAPTWSAAKGIFESIARLASGDAWITPLKVEVCRRVGEGGGEVRYQRYTTNYGGPLRKSNQLRLGSSYQLFATVLADVCYRLHGEVVRSKGEKIPGANPRHHLQDLFERRIEQGRAHRTPCLGWSEFTANYWGPFRDGTTGRPAATEIDDALNIEIPSMLRTVFDRPVGGKFQPRFDQKVTIRKGMLVYAE
ncbi:MAG: CRISPR-associated protein Cas5 [Blastocatellia bacterium]|nr:CRISPR-associated protein Cas5 [Blastocatellia bacterium]